MAMMIDQQSGFRTALGQFAAELPRLKGADRMLLVNQLRRLALASELHSAAEVVGGMADAIAREEGSALLGPWLAAIDQAASCTSETHDVAPLLLATVGVRYAH
ncbi:hypothetical protein HL653_19450 [Sphingomonas sp. AP4-R1]|uniref:hypothetical protein n=1 Tax=Sphingomonas sp. AP4-R1 TaxID=2735134 RepID=UPI001493A022|nr:hypothetical protein [Sphingomonas sp. AP4-R1]QJU59638.1 hypothetical protein HL653_19450 [Sphingomonas sp. AP4-R1]